MKITAAIVSGILLMCGSLPAFAQFDNLTTVLRAGAHDAETISKAYLKPLPSGLGANINSGWANTAKTHKLLGFDLQIRGALSFIPKSDKTFDLTGLNLQKIRPASPSHTISPTIGGYDETGPEVVVKDNGEEVASFNLPEGSGYSAVPAPMIQAGIGLVKHTDLIARVIPKVSYEGNDLKMIGFGLKHSISQWLPGGSAFPLDISLLGGFTNIDVNSDNIDVQPSESAIPNPNSPDAIAAKTDNTYFDNQRGSVSIKTFTVKALVGKSLPFVSLYAGVGYETSSMDVDVTGNYPVNASYRGQEVFDVIKDPFSYSDEGQNEFSALGGVTLKLGFFHIFGEYTLAKYPAASAGLGFSFR